MFCRKLPFKNTKNILKGPEGTVHVTVHMARRFIQQKPVIFYIMKLMTHRGSDGNFKAKNQKEYHAI